MTFGIMQHLHISLCPDADNAIARGYTQTERYAKAKPVEIKDVVIVQNGTETGNPTVDLLLHDKDGNEYLVMVTGRLLKSLPL